MHVHSQSNTFTLRCIPSDVDWLRGRVTGRLCIANVPLGITDVHERHRQTN